MTASRTRVKLCGMQGIDDVTTAVEAGADAIGVISQVSVDSPREVDTDVAARIIDHTPPFVTSVLVTMPKNLEEARTIMDALAPDAIQIHGDLPADVAESLARDYTVIRAFDVTERDAILAHDGIVDALLIDSTDERGGGGTGRTHDWDRTRRYVEALESPVILAGGLSPENVEDAIEEVRPYAVDVASGIEGPHGKDTRAMNRFVAAAGGQ